VVYRFGRSSYLPRLLGEEYPRINPGRCRRRVRKGRSNFVQV